MPFDALTLPNLPKLSRSFSRFPASTFPTGWNQIAVPTPHFFSQIVSWHGSCLRRALRSLALTRQNFNLAPSNRNPHYT